jgi:hypothetical protein
MSFATRNHGREWSRPDIRHLGTLAGQNTPTRVVGFKLGRISEAVQSKTSAGGVSLKPANQSPASVIEP